MRARLGTALAAVLWLSTPAVAYTPGSGTLYSESFEAALDPDWEQGNGISPNPSPWTRVADGADTSLHADGYGPYFNSPTRHWARHWVQPTRATAFSIAFEHRAELGAGYVFDLDVEQRAPVLRKYRLRVDGSGNLLLFRTENGAFVQVGSSAGVVPVNQKRWIRFSIEPDGGGVHPRVRARVWSGGATSEPTPWTLDVLDDRDTLARVHRFELVADGPKGVETWIDDLDAWGDLSEGCASSVRTIWLMETSHLDIGFTAPPDDIEAFAKTHVDQVLQNLAADPDYRWTLESSWWLDRWWERSTETERDTMVDRLREGRLQLTAGYASLHTTTAGHEELTRNLYWASRFAREHEVPLRTWITDDVPGSTFALPELLDRSGLDFFVGGMNTTFGGRITAPDHGDRPFWWEGPDGSKVLSWITFDSYAEAFDYGFSFFDNLDAMVEKMGKKIPELEEAGYPWTDLLLMRAFDNHYQGFHARNLVEQWNATYENPVFRLATAEEFFDHMLALHGPEAFPTFRGDFGAAWSASHANTPHTEALVREAHRKGRSAEAHLAAGSAIDRAPVPRSDLDRMFRMMLQVDEHSGAGGWPGYFTPEEMDRNNTIHLSYAQEAASLASSLHDHGLDRALAELPAPGDAIAVVNPLGRERTGYARATLPPEIYGTTFRVVERGTGNEIPYQRFDATSEILFLAEAVPPVGYRVYDLLPGSPAAIPDGMLEATATTLENDAYRVTIDPADGAVTSLFDKVRGVEMVDASSAYDFNELATATKSQIDAASAPTAQPPTSAATTLLSAGPLEAAIRVTRTGTSHVETTYRLRRGEDRFEFENVLDRSLMPYVTRSVGTRAYTVSLPFDIHGFSIRTETTTRFLDPLTDGFPRDSVFDWHNVEHTLSFWDGTKGALVAVDRVDAHSFVRFSTFPPPAWTTSHANLLSRLLDKVDEYEFEGGTVGPFTIEPGTSPIHRSVHHVRATAPSFDPVAASRFGFEALTPFTTRVLARRPGNLPDGAASFFRVDAPGVLLYTAKPAESGSGVVLRMTELKGAPATTVRVSSDVFAWSSPERVEQDEDGGEPLSTDGEAFLVPIGPYETATVRVQAAPAWAPIELRVGKDAGSGTVRLTWTGGVSPYTVVRAEEAAFSGAVTTLVDEQGVAAHDDPVLGDGRTWFYLVR